MDDDCVTFVPMAAVEEESGVLDPSLVRPWPEVKKGYTKFEEGDVLVAKITPSMENGKAALAHGLHGGRGVGSTEFHVLRPSDQIDARYLLHFVLQASTRRAARAQMRGVAGQLRVPPDFFDTIEIPVPPIDEQRAIVAEIETQFARLDDAVAALQRARTRLKRYRASVLKAACEGRLVPTEAELARQEGRSYEPASVLLERIRAERESAPGTKRGSRTGSRADMGSAPTSDLSELPEGWAWTTWENLADRVTVGHVGPMKHEYVPCGIPFLRSQNVRKNRFDAEGLLYITPEFHQRLSKSTLQPNDLVVVRSGSVGVTCVIPEELGEANCADLVIIQRPHSILSKYGAYFMNSVAKRFVRAGQVGVALTHFNTKSVASMPVAVPPLDEQKRIVGEVERLLSVIDQMEAMVEANLKRAASLRQAVLRMAFSGRLVDQPTLIGNSG